MIGVKTSNEQKSGTNEDVYCMLIGSSGRTSPLQFDKGGYDDFERGAYDVYSITHDDIGEIRSVVFSLVQEGASPTGTAKEIVDLADTISRSLGLGRVSRWGKGRGSPAWRLEFAQVMVEDGVQNLGSMRIPKAKSLGRFTFDQWIQVGETVSITKD